VSYYMPWRHMGGEEVYLLFILNLGTRWGWVVSVTPWPRFTPGERTPPVPIGQEAGWAPEPVRTQSTGRKILCLCRGSNPGRPVRSQSLYWLSYADKGVIKDTEAMRSGERRGKTTNQTKRGIKIHSSFTVVHTEPPNARIVNGLITRPCITRWELWNINVSNICSPSAHRCCLLS
jgi:hypothetical protein